MKSGIVKDKSYSFTLRIITMAKWLRDSKIVPESTIVPLEVENLELIHILTAIVKTSQTNTPI